ncbi:MAG: extracellular solute-binding protein [Planctomycetes bacterium]|nr:extracellular solute-binding protein [Planctomycetota bacterium]
MHVAPKLFLVAVALVLLAAAGLMYVGSSAPGSRELVVYTSVDPEYAEALARRFEARTGLAVALRTDSEETKTTGMLNVLRQRKDRPDGDVFWNSELSGTLVLAKEGLFEPYASPQAAGIPAAFKDAGALWTGFGCRARVLVFNTRRVKKEDAPASLEVLCEPAWRGRFCMARPLFGTTRSHLVSLVLALGEERGFELLRKLRENASAGGTKEWIMPGNSHVRDRVADGTFDAGLTDTDDVFAGQRNGQDVDLIPLQQTADWPGVYLIPNTVAVLKGTLHQEAARRFVDFLLDPETEAWLAEQGARQIPVRSEVPVPAGMPSLKDFQPAAFDAEALREKLESLSERIDRLVRGVER